MNKARIDIYEFFQKLKYFSNSILGREINKNCNG